jgi:putative ABC transport system substrate-binding protein
MNNRRKLTIAFGAGALVLPFTSFAQQPAKIAHIGILTMFPVGKDYQIEVFKQQLRDLGHVEGKTIAIDYLPAEGKYERLPEFAAELVRRNVDIIVALGGTPAAVAAKNATKTIPIVFTSVADPVGQGIVDSLARPGGNVTGATNQARDVAGKSLALFKEVLPSAKRIAILANWANLSVPLMLSEYQAAAKTLRLELIVIKVISPSEFDRAFAEIALARPAGLVINSDRMLNAEAVRLATLAAKHRLPTISMNNVFPESGGLMSYGANRPDMVRRTAIQVDKILKGTKPADLPVEQPTKFDLVVNMRTAKDLRIKIPNSILVQATKVIE